MIAFDELTWSAARLDEALALLSRRAGLAPRAVDLASPRPDLGADGAAVWLAVAADRLGVECEEHRPRLRELERFLARSAPLLVLVPGAPTEPLRFALVLSARRGTLRLLAPDGSAKRVGVRTLAERLSAHVRGSGAAALDTLLDEIGLAGGARRRAAAALTEEHFGSTEVTRAFQLTVPPGRSFVRQLARRGLFRRVAVIVAAHFVAYGLFLTAWYTVGRGALQGTLETGWLVAWGLLLLTIVPLRMLEGWSQEVFGVEAGVLLRRRLVAGSLRQHPDEIRHMGAGELLGRVLESEAVEILALSTVFLGLGAVLDLAAASWVLWMGAAGPAHLGALALFAVTAVALAVRHHRRVAAGTDARLAVSNDLVERLLGHRTRQVQQAREHWHDAEDRLLEGYLETARRQDSSSIIAGSVVPTGWLAAGIAVLGPALFAGATPGLLAVSLGGCLLAQQALSRLVGGALQTSALLVAWRKVEPLFSAARREEPTGVPEVAAERDASAGEVVLDARRVRYRHTGRGDATLRDVSLAIRRGERVLLTGPSGGGKSTLAAVLTGLRAPESGLVLLAGLDRSTWGAEAWRRRVAAAPQYHENYVFSGPLAFNLLLGRRWPATPEDLAEAEEVCRELGLSDLLDRMPSGIMQTVGETGWQLSHGERGRVFVARALLQGGDVVIFDESLAALDPESLRRSADCIRRRAPALVAIAHP